MLQIGPWGPAPVRFQYPQICTKGLSQKKIGPADSPPPRCPPGPGFLSVERGGGLPSTRNWPFRWPLSPTSPPQVVRDTQGNEPPADRGGGFGGWSCTSAATRGQRALLRFFNSSGLVKREVPGPLGAAPEGLAGMAELRPLFPEVWQEEEGRCFFTRLF
jgi:hypothetical protein